MLAELWLWELGPERGEVLDGVEAEHGLGTAGDVGLESEGSVGWGQESGFCARDILVNPQDFLPHG
jgi:hypothetical protein